MFGISAWACTFSDLSSFIWLFLHKCPLFLEPFINNINLTLQSEILNENLMQACNAHGLYCVPLYDTLGRHISSLSCSPPQSVGFKAWLI